MTAATTAIPTPETFTPAARWLATVAVLSAFFTSIFTGTMVNVAIPEVMGTFGVGQGQAQFLSSTFLAMNTTGLLASSWTLSKFGQRPTFFFIMILFACAGLLCYVAPTLETLIVGRVLQGLAAGLLQPLVMLVLFQVFPVERRGLAMGMFSMGVTVALGLGPTIGGVVIDAFNWRAIFLVPIPASLGAMLLGYLFMPPEAQRSPAGRFDMLGFGLINATVFCWFTMLGNGQRWGWSSDDIMLLAAATILFGFAFVASQMRIGATLLDLRLFRNLRFAAALAIAFLFGFSNFASVYAFPIFGQIVQNFTPTIAGSMLLPGSLFAALVLPFAGRASDKAPTTVVIAFGLIVISLSIGMLAGADANTAYWYVAFSLLLGRFGSAFVTPAINTTALGALTHAEMRRGAGVANLSLMLGGSTGVGVYVLILEQRIEFHAVNLGATQTSANAATAEMLAAVAGRLEAHGMGEATQYGMAIDYLDRVITAQANMLGFQDGFVMLAMIALLPMIPLMLLMRKR